MFKGFGTSEWRTTSVTLGAIGEVECGNSSLSKNGSNLGSTAELTCWCFRGLIETPGALFSDRPPSEIGFIRSTGDLRLVLWPSRFAAPLFPRLGFGVIGTIVDEVALLNVGFGVALVLATGGK